MIIKVTQEHIDNGIVGIGASCPIALAIKEHIQKDDVSVGAWGIRIDEGHFNHSPESFKFMRMFDVGIPVTPIELIIERYKRPLTS